jgi:hypothetical protein
MGSGWGPHVYHRWAHLKCDGDCALGWGGCRCRMTDTSATMASMDSVPATPPRSQTPEAREPPPAPKRRRTNTAVDDRWDGSAEPRPPALDIPDRRDGSAALSGNADPLDGRGAGLPIPVPDLTQMTRQEARAYMMRHLEPFLTGNLERQARQLERRVLNPEDVQDSDVRNWPAARLYRIKCALSPDRPATEELYHTIGSWTYGACRYYLLTGGQRQIVGLDPAITQNVESAMDLAIGFLTEDRLTGSELTLMDIWSWSPFEALRRAPPLSNGGEAEATEVKTRDPTNMIVAATLAITVYFWLLAWFVDTRCR